MRCPGLGLVGRWSPEWPIVRLLNDETERRSRGDVPRSQVLRCLPSGAVVGFATWSASTRATAPSLVDLYCHPAHWNQAERLFGALQIPQGKRLITYAEPEHQDKLDVLSRLGFRQKERLRGVPVNWLRPEMGMLPGSPAAATLARVAAPIWMALRGVRRRQGGRVNATQARTDLWVYEKG